MPEAGVDRVAPQTFARRRGNSVNWAKARYDHLGTGLRDTAKTAKAPLSLLQ